MDKTEHQIKEFVAVTAVYGSNGPMPQGGKEQRWLSLHVSLFRNLYLQALKKVWGEGNVNLNVVYEGNECTVRYILHKPGGPEAFSAVGSGIEDAADKLRKSNFVREPFDSRLPSVSVSCLDRYMVDRTTPRQVFRCSDCIVDDDWRIKELVILDDMNQEVYRREDYRTKNAANSRRMVQERREDKGGGRAGKKAASDRRHGDVPDMRNDYILQLLDDCRSTDELTVLYDKTPEMQKTKYMTAVNQRYRELKEQGK